MLINDSLKMYSFDESLHTIFDEFHKGIQDTIEKQVLNSKIEIDTEYRVAYDR